MAKRGRKRHSGERYKSGKLKARPLGPTAELMAKRVAAFVIAGVKPEKDINFASSWLGVLFAAEVITEAQYHAGNNYHMLYKLMWPQGFPGSVLDPAVEEMHGELVQPFSDGSASSDDLAIAWRKSEDILKALGCRTHELVKDICVFGYFKSFIDTSSPRSIEAKRADAQDRTRVIEGLDALAMAYDYKGGSQKNRLAA